MGKSGIDSYENGTVRGVVCGQRLYRDVCMGAEGRDETDLFQVQPRDAGKEGVTPDYIIYNFPELLSALRFFEESRA